MPKAKFVRDRTVGPCGAVYVSPVRKVICKFGDITELAREVGCSDTLVNFWLTGRKRVSERLAPKLEEVTGIPKHIVRPDLWREDGRRKPRRRRRRKA